VRRSQGLQELSTYRYLHVVYAYVELTCSRYCLRFFKSIIRLLTTKFLKTANIKLEKIAFSLPKIE